MTLFFTSDGFSSKVQGHMIQQSKSYSKLFRNENKQIYYIQTILIYMKMHIYNEEMYLRIHINLLKVSF